MQKLPGVRTSVLTILLILFLVAILPMYILGYGIYQWGYRMTTDEIAQSLHTRASFFMTTLDTEFRRIYQVHQECLNDSDLYYNINALPIMNDYERISGFRSIEKRVGLICDSSAYIEDVTLWIPQLSRMVSASRGWVDSSDPAVTGWKSLVNAPFLSGGSGFAVYDGNLYLCATYPLNIGYPDYVPQYILAVRLSNEKIMEDLMSFNLYPDSGTVLQSEEQLFRLETGQEMGAGGQELLSVKVDSDFLNLQMQTYVPERIIYSGLETYRNLFILFTAVALLLFVIFFTISKRRIGRPVRRLVDSLKLVESGRLDIRIDYQANDEFGYLYTAFNQMVKALANMLELNIKQLKLTQEAELRQLQAQINPHFLHNCFFILYRMAKDEDYENISEFLTYLSEYYRYLTRNASLEVTLSDEDSHARRYVQIQLVRFAKRISAEFAPLPETLKDCRVPKLILQPLLENAFLHGFKDTISGGLLRVWYEEHEEKLHIIVEDNGAGLAAWSLEELQGKLHAAADAGRERHGIVNIHQRLRLRFGPECGLKIEKLPERGTRFTLILVKDRKEVLHVSDSDC